jgi:hypothetical protein
MTGHSGPRRSSGARRLGRVPAIGAAVVAATLGTSGPEGPLGPAAASERPSIDARVERLRELLPPPPEGEHGARAPHRQFVQFYNWCNQNCG